jgi:1,4-alpha-glucan branching enzyme
MISCALHPDGRRVVVTFTVTDATRADHRVNVVGDFNDWDTCATPMHTVDDTHTGTVALYPDRRYRFRYLSSHYGWFNDDAGTYEFNEFGQKNSVVDLAIVNLDGLRRRPSLPGTAA